MRGSVTLLAILTAGALLLAGCSSSKTDTSTSGTSASGSGTGSHTGSATGSASGSGTATGSATGTGSAGGSGGHPLPTLSASLRNGTAPLPVTFGVAAAGTDSKSKWSLDFGDNSPKATGTTFPGQARHNYTAAGTFQAKLTVTWGDGQSKDNSLSIAVVPVGGARSGPLYRMVDNTTVTYSGGAFQVQCVDTFPASLATCERSLAEQAHSTNAATNGTFYRWYDVPVPAGAASLAINAGSHATQTCTPLVCEPDYDVFVKDAAGAWHDDATSPNDWESYAAKAPGAGTWSVCVVYFLGGPNGDMGIDVTVN